MTTRRTAMISVSLSMLAACGGGGGGGDAGATPAPPASPTPLPPPAMPAGWTRLADLPVGLAKFGVAAATGRLYVAGGYDTRSSLYIYDIAADRWDTGPAMPQGSDNLAMLAAGDRLYAIGGEARTAVQVLDPATNQWSAGPASPVIRFASAAAVLAGRLHLVGGWNYSNTSSDSLASHGVFDPAAQAWSAAAPLATARNAAGAAVVGDRLYVVGGRAPGIRANDQTSLASVEVYDPASDRWTAAPPLPTARGSLAAVALGGQIYALGGEGAPGTVSGAVERLDPFRGIWTTLPDMPAAVHGLGAVAVGDSIYVLGGFSGASDAVNTASRALYRYTPVTA